jgi:hypothetical protein
LTPIEVKVEKQLALMEKPKDEYVVVSRPSA